MPHKDQRETNTPTRTHISDYHKQRATNTHAKWRSFFSFLHSNTINTTHRKTKTQHAIRLLPRIILHALLLVCSDVITTSLPIPISAAPLIVVAPLSRCAIQSAAAALALAALSYQPSIRYFPPVPPTTCAPIPLLLP